jgi:Ig-like domain from next to BRCA1 gene
MQVSPSRLRLLENEIPSFWIVLAASLSSFFLTSPAAAQYNPDPVGVLTQRYSPQRNGANIFEHALTVASVSSPEFQELYSVPVNGQVYAQPLLVPGVPFPDGTVKNVLIVATMQNNVFAFQVDDAIHGPAFAPKPLWNLAIGPAVAANFIPMGYSTWSCSGTGAGGCWGNADPPSSAAALPPVGSPPGHTTWFGYASINGEGIFNINPAIGILSTPVIDRPTNKVFVVGKLDFGTGPENDLVAIDYIHGIIVQRTKITGHVIGSAPDAQNGIITFDQVHHMNRPALLLQNGEIYIAFGSHQDTPPWHGWVFRYEAKTLEQSGVWCSTPNALGGSIWQAGSGIAGDDAGNLYVMTGNGCNLESGGHCADSEYPAELNPPPDNSFNTSMSNFANMFVRLNPEVAAPTPIVPGDEQHRESEDLDLGSAGPVFVPGTSSLVGGDKEGRYFVLSTAAQLGLTQTLQVAQTADGGSIHGSGYHHIHGSPVFWRGPEGMMAYVWPERDYLRALHWSDAAAQFDCPADPNGCENGNTTTPDQQSAFQSPDCGGCMPGGIVSISSEGATSGTGILWASLPLPTNDPALIGGGLNKIVPGVLHALDAEDITQDLWNSENNSGRDGSFMFAKYNPPVVANGRVYMATFGSLANGGTQTFTGSVNVYGLRQWAKFLSQTYPSTPLPIGTTFQASVTFFNDGTTTWTPGAYSLQLVDVIPGAPANTPTSIPLPAAVSPGNEVTFTMNLPAPVAGTFRYLWRMNQQHVEQFGDLTPWSSVQVGGKLAVATRVFGLKTTVTVTDATANRPVAGATVVVFDDSGGDSFTTDASGKVTFPTPMCTTGNEMGVNGKPARIRVPCSAMASKPGYGDVHFFIGPS